VKCKEFLEGYNGAISDDEEGDDVGVRPKKYMKLLVRTKHITQSMLQFFRNFILHTAAKTKFLTASVPSGRQLACFELHMVCWC
jgi:hypothetical protein